MSTTSMSSSTDIPEHVPPRKGCYGKFGIVQCIYIPVVFLGAAAISPLFIVFDQYVYQYYAVLKGIENGTSPSNVSHCGVNKTAAEDEVDALSSLFTMYSKIACDIPAFITMPIWAAYGDMYGRRNPVIIASVGILVSLAILLCVEFWKLPIWVTLFYSAIQGLSGYLGLAVCIACAAHISHYSTPGRRTMEMAILELTYYVGGTAGDLGGGFLLRYTNFFWCYAAVGLIVLFLLVYCVVVLKSGADIATDKEEVQPIPTPTMQSIQDTDSEPLLASTEISQQSKTFSSIILQPVQLYFSRRHGEGSTIKLQLWLILFIAYLHDSAHGGSYAVIDIFALSSPLCWTPILLGYYRGGDMFMVGVGAVVTSLLFKSHLRAEWLLFMGQVSGAIRGVLLGVATTDAFMYGSMVAGALRVLCIATCRSMASTLVQPDQHGAAIGGIASIQILCDVLSGTILSLIYAKTVTFYAGLVFFVTSLFYLIGMPLTGWYAYLSNRRARMHTSVDL